MTASTKRLIHTQQSRQPLGANGFALSPIRAVFLDSSRRVCRTGGEDGVRLLHLRPHTSVLEGGRPARPRKTTGRTTAFLRLPAPFRSTVEKRRPQRRCVCRGLGSAHYFGGRTLTTPALGAENVTYSGRICGSPRFALQRFELGMRLLLLHTKQRPQRTKPGLS